MLNSDKTLVSKVLVFEENPGFQEKIKHFCDENGLVPIRQCNYSAMNVLYSSIDLGAVLLSELSHDSSKGLHNGLDLAVHIHNTRPELPIFLRRNTKEDLNDLTEEQQSAIAGAYTINNLERLTELTAQYLADSEYPISLIKHIEEVTRTALESTIKDITIKTGRPYLVKDKLVYGDILSLLPIQAPWFNGYMMFQTEEVPMVDLIANGKTAIETGHVDFRNVMDLLSEISNMSWGGLKIRLLALHSPEHEEQQTITVPITVNQCREFISFGTDRSQLCIEYMLIDNNSELIPVKLYQKFIFNIKWTPEEYRRADESTLGELVESGVLVLF